MIHPPFPNFPSWRPYQSETIDRILNSKDKVITISAPTGCHTKGQGILMYDGSIKSVEDIQVGDLLMGPDSEAREVTQLFRGRGLMYEVIPTKGDSFIVNEDHILSLVRTDGDLKHRNIKIKGKVDDISVKDWLNLSKTQKHVHKLFRVPVIFRLPQIEDLPIDPYFLGLLLGDGSLKRQVNITTMDSEITDSIYNNAEQLNLKVRESSKQKTVAKTYSFYSQFKHRRDFRGNPISNILQKKLRNIGLFPCSSSNKFIPSIYKTSSTENRLEILAGLIDTDGSLQSGVYDFISKSKRLAEDTAFIARSLGLAAYIIQCEKSCQNNFKGTYYRVGISGNCSIIPCKVKRKIASPRKQKKDVLRTGFSIEKIGYGDYYGFTLKGLGYLFDIGERYLLDDFTVTHNSGKSIIGMTLCKEYQRSLYLCSTKTLQSQLQKDFPEAVLLMGRNNYPCIYNRMTESSFPQITCEDCIAEFNKELVSYSDSFMEDGRFCKSKCIYEKQKKLALKSQITITNMTYFIIESNFIGRFTGCNMVVVDECDELESEMLRFVSLNISDKQMERFKLEPPQYKTKVESWKVWANHYLPYIGKQLEILGMQLKKGREDISFLRSYKSVNALHKKMTIFKDIVDDTWIYEERKDRWEFKPIWISQFMKDNFWDHADRFVLMSATPPPPKLLGLENCEQIEIPSQFSKENRRIIYQPMANLTHKTMDEERPKLLKGVREIIDSHPNEKGLIHTVSYSLADYLVKNLNNGRIITHDGKGRTNALETFKKCDYPAVLISPSMDRGVDLPYDECRFLICCKLPFPDLSDKQVSSRLYSGSFGKYWYASQTANTLQQMTGRGCRSIDDTCVSYILDRQFENFYGHHSGFLHGWWTEALEFRE